MPKIIDIAHRLESAAYNGVSRTLKSDHCREAANEIRRLRIALAEISDPTLTVAECRQIAREALGWKP